MCCVYVILVCAHWKRSQALSPLRGIVVLWWRGWKMVLEKPHTLNQNLLLNVMAPMLQKILSAVQSAGPFSLLAVESKDISKTEQLTIVLRYVDESLLTAWQNEGISKQVVSQEYDGASVMSRRCCGVQKWIREFALQARYIRCYAHNLNLGLVNCVKNKVCLFFLLL